MRKAILSPAYGAQEIPEVEFQADIKEPGTYAVTGYDRPVNVQPVTEYGAEQIRSQYPNAIFFEGADGGNWYGIRTGKFA